MSSADDRQSSATRQQGLIKGPLKLPSRMPVEQTPPGTDATLPRIRVPSPQSSAPPSTQPLSNPGRGPARGPLSLPSRVPIEQPPIFDTPSPTGVSPFPQQYGSPALTRPLEPLTPPGSPALTDPALSPNITRPLSAETGVLPLLVTTTTRQPVVIRGTGKRRTPSNKKRPPRSRRWRIQIAVTTLVVLIAIGTLLTVVPIDQEGDHIFNPFQTINNLVRSGNNFSSLAPQDATATVTHQDGYDPGTYLSPGGAYDHFAYGQCTYWAALRYHQLSGHWIPWMGNAYQWVYGAQQYGWNVSSKPRVPSIIVLQPGVQGAGWYGHVAVVESINSDGSVVTSDWNWYQGGGGWARTSYVTFRPGPGVSFIWV